MGCFALLMWSFHHKHLSMFVLVCTIKTSFLLWMPWMVTVTVSLSIAVLFRIHAWLSLKMQNFGLDVVTYINCGLQYHYHKPHNREQEASWKICEDNNKPIAKTTKTGQTEDLYQYLCNIVALFLTHCFIKRKQAERYEKDKAY